MPTSPASDQINQDRIPSSRASAHRMHAAAHTHKRHTAAHTHKIRTRAYASAQTRTKCMRARARKGAGVVEWPDGRRYEGDFDDGFRHGFGETGGGGGGGGQMV